MIHPARQLSPMNEILPLVSIIIPTYNRAALLPRAIQSIQKQDVLEIEIIVIDDGSTDETQSMLHKVDEPRLRCIRFPENKGIGAARFTGVEAARGGLIAFLDSDDEWTEGKLALQLQAFQKFSQFELIFGDYLNINYISGEKELGFTQHKAAMTRMAVKLISPEMDLWEITGGQPQAMLEDNFIATPTVVFRRNIIDKIGNFNHNLSGPEDFEFWWRAAMMGIRVGFINRPLMLRHKDEVSITSNTIRFVPRKLTALDACAENAQKSNRKDLIKPVRLAKSKAWQSLVWAYACSGERREAWNAFRHSICLGPSLDAVVGISVAIAGPGSLHLLRNLKAQLFRSKHT